MIGRTGKFLKSNYDSVRDDVTFGGRLFHVLATAIMANA